MKESFSSLNISINRSKLVALFLITLVNKVKNLDIVNVYDLLHIKDIDPETNQTVNVYTSDEIYSFPWNTNVSNQ
jgi:hypothetical protein